MEFIKSELFRINQSDFVKGLVVAALSGFALPILAAIQTPGFDIHTISWHGVWVLAYNGAIAGFVSYLAKQFMTDSNGKVMGVLG